MIDYQLLLNFIIALFVGVSAGYLGSLMVLKRMSLVGDALSHVALPGMGIALIYGINPFWGAFIFLLTGVLAIWFLEARTRLPTEALVGVIFTGSLAIGFLVTPDPEILEVLFGDISKTGFFDGMMAVILSLITFFITWRIYKKLILGIISEDLAAIEKIKVSRLNLVYLLLIAVVVALGVKVVGSLLMGALVIIPAVAARNLARSLGQYIFFASFIGAFSAMGGILMSRLSGFPPGPLIILCSGFIFLISIVLGLSRKP